MKSKPWVSASIAGVSLACVALFSMYYAEVAVYLGMTQTSILAIGFSIFVITFVMYMQVIEKAALDFHQSDLREATNPYFLMPAMNKESSIWGRVSLYFHIYIVLLFLLFYSLNQSDGYLNFIFVICFVAIARLLGMLLTRLFNGEKVIATLLGFFITIIVVLYGLEVLVLDSQRRLVDYIVSLILVVVASVSLLLLVSFVLHWIKERIWYSFVAFFCDLKLLDYGNESEKTALKSLQIWSREMYSRRYTLIMLLSPLFFSAAHYIGIRYITVLCLLASFLPLLVGFSRFCAVLPPEKYFLAIKASFFYLVLGVLMWTLHLHFAFFLYNEFAGWYQQLSINAMPALIPDFILSFNHEISNNLILTQLEGSIIAFVLLVNLSYLLSAFRTQQWARLAGQLILVSLFGILTAYNEWVSIDDITQNQGNLVTPAAVLFTLLPIIIDLVLKSLSKIAINHKNCPSCEEPNNNQHNFCVLCGYSLNGAYSGLHNRSADYLYNIRLSYIKHIKQKNMTVDEAQTRLLGLLEGINLCTTLDVNPRDLSRYREDLISGLEKYRAPK